MLEEFHNIYTERQKQLHFSKSKKCVRSIPNATSIKFVWEITFVIWYI